MSEFKGTPGPWEARYSAVIDVEKDEIIAVMTCGSVYRKNELEDYDTARLIAAAPELLEALQDLLIAAENIGGEHIEGMVHLDGASSIARAAIAKATGDQQ